MGALLVSDSADDDSSAGLPPNSLPSTPRWVDDPPPESAASAFSPQLTEAEQGWMLEWHTIAFLAASGLGSGEIARQINYTPARVSTVLHMPEVQERIARIRAADHEKFGKRLAQAAPKVLDYYLDVAFGVEKGDPHRLRASEWVMEKHDGKAVQKTQNDGGNTALDLIRALKDLRTENAAPTPKSDDAIDVTPVAAEPEDPATAWVRQNLKPEGSK